MLKKKNAARILAIGIAAAMILGVLGVSFASFAATATVTGDSVNVRSTPSTESSRVGTVTAGTTFEVGDPETGADGREWYKVTLSNGQSGYIRGDLLNVVQDTPEQTETSPATATEPEETGATEPSVDSSTETTSSTTSSERYRIVNVPDDAGNEVWYVYDYTDGIRIKIEDLKQFDTYKDSAEKNAKSASRFRILMVLFAILLVAAIVAATLLALRLRDVTSSDVDLAEARRKERKRNRNADDVSRLAGSRNQAGTRSRENAYPSGHARTAGGAQQAPRAARTQSGQADRAERAAAARQAGAQQRAPRPDGAEQRAARQQQAQARPVQQRPAQPAGQAPQAQQQAQAPRPAAQPRNFAVDDDMDYDFLNSGK